MTTEPIGPQPEHPQPHRRVAVIPLALAAIGVVVAVVLAVVVFGLAAVAPPTVSHPTPTPPPAAMTPRPSPTATAPARVAGSNECADARGDGVGIDLDSIGLSADGDRLRIVFVLGEPVPDSDASLEVYADGGEARFQIAVVLSDGEVDEFFAYRLPDSATHDDGDAADEGDRDRRNGRPGDYGERRDNGNGHRIDLKTKDVEIEGSVVVATVGKGVLDDLGGSFLWYAYATADHDPADACYLDDGSLVPFDL